MSIRTVSILGATGSIGRNTLDVIAAHPDKFKIKSLTAYASVEAMSQIIIKFQPEAVCMVDSKAAAKIRDLFPELTVYDGEQGLLSALDHEADLVMAAIVGMAGLRPTMKAIEQGRIVAFASKECLVGAGQIMMQAVEENGTTLLPVDSEHNAIFQVFDQRRRTSITRLILTASGGPFRTREPNTLKDVTPEEAIKHPNWSMGAKISVDSATLMNKGLEVIEACYLFDMPPEKVDVVIHPQSIIHSMVEYSDGSILSQMGAPDMRTPISYCLGYPKRVITPGERLSLSDMPFLQFEPVDSRRFPSLNLAYDALRSGPAACLAYNTVNEIMVDLFLKKKLGFMEIVKQIDGFLSRFDNPKLDTLEDVIACDSQIRAQFLQK